MLGFFFAVFVFFFLFLQQFDFYCCLLCDPLETLNLFLWNSCITSCFPAFMQLIILWSLHLCSASCSLQADSPKGMSILHAERQNVLALVYRYVNYIHCTSGWFSVQEKCACICKKFGKKHMIFLYLEHLLSHSFVIYVHTIKYWHGTILEQSKVQI